MSTDLFFCADSGALHALLEKAFVVVTTKELLPVLKNFQLTAGSTERSANQVQVLASNLEQSMLVSTTVAEVSHGGTVLVPAKRMMEIMRSAGARAGTVEIEVADSTAQIRIGRARWTVRLTQERDYPPLPDLDTMVWATTDRARFLTALASVRGAVSKNIERIALMMIDIAHSRLTACDGLRFQQASVLEFPLSLQIPANAVDDLSKLLRSSESTELEIGTGERHCAFRIGADVFVLRKLMTRFPDVEHLLLRPALENRYPLELGRQELIDAIKRVRVNADPETSAVRLALTPGTLTISSSDKQGNSAQEALTVVWDSKDQELILNHLRLVELLQSQSGVSCLFKLGNSSKTKKAPLMLRDDDAGTVGVIQQMSSDWIT
jgi:DNA polymerase III sliding clamp (beta) subunit (PCNA family)